MIYFGRIKILKKIIDWATEKATKKIAESDKLKKATLLGVYLFVAIPLPGTGAWMGSLIANFLDLEPKKAMLPIIMRSIYRRSNNADINSYSKSVESIIYSLRYRNR